MSPSNWHLPCTSTRIKLWVAAAADLQHPLKEVQNVDQEWVNMCSGRNWLNRSSGSWIFSGDFMSSILASPCIWKSTKILHGDSWLAVTFTSLAETCKKYVLVCMFSSFTKVPHTLTSPATSLEQFLRAIWNAVSQAIVPILPHIKLTSQLSHCEFFFFQAKMLC